MTRALVVILMILPLHLSAQKYFKASRDYPIRVQFSGGYGGFIAYNNSSFFELGKTYGPHLYASLPIKGPLSIGLSTRIVHSQFKNMTLSSLANRYNTSGYFVHTENNNADIYAGMHILTPEVSYSFVTKYAEVIPYVCIGGTIGYGTYTNANIIRKRSGSNYNEQISFNGSIDYALYYGLGCHISKRVKKRLAIVLTVQYGNVQVDYEHTASAISFQNEGFVLEKINSRQLYAHLVSELGIQVLLWKE